MFNFTLAERTEDGWRPVVSELLEGPRPDGDAFAALFQRLPSLRPTLAYRWTNAWRDA